MKIENIKLLRFISKKSRTINMAPSIMKRRKTIEPKIILMKVFSPFLRLALAEIIPKVKFIVVKINARITAMN
jgi:hypothetical protein